MSRDRKGPFRIRPWLFPAVVVVTIGLLGAFLVFGPFFSPYGGERPVVAIAIPVGIAILMALGIWWIVRRARS